MSEKHCAARLFRSLFLTILFGLPLPSGVLAVTDMNGFLPQHVCAAGWQMSEKPLFYDRETLSDRINGEAELYMPYGFERMAAARYATKSKPAAGMDVEIYRMGSTLDAFGMFSNYRQKDGLPAAAGAESSLSGSQIFFYRGRHFVHIQETGSTVADSGALAECARTVSSLLPGTVEKPPELAVFDAPEMTGGTGRYLPQSLLGYDFFSRGIMTDAVLNGANFQIFVLLGTSTGTATSANDRYRSHLTHVTVETGNNGASYLEGIDPLYGPVIVLKQGDCLAGALKFSSKTGIKSLLERVCRR